MESGAEQVVVVLSSSPDERDLPIQRLVATTSPFTGFLARPRSWLGDGPLHTGVDQISETLRTAGALVARYGADMSTHQTRTARATSTPPEPG